MSAFLWVYKPYTFGWRGGVCENQHLFCTLLTFWPDFYYFHRDFWHSKYVDVYSFGGKGSQKVYGLNTHENVDIYGPPLNEWLICLILSCGWRNHPPLSRQHGDSSYHSDSPGSMMLTYSIVMLSLSWQHEGRRHHCYAITLTLLAVWADTIVMLSLLLSWLHEVSIHHGYAITLTLTAAWD